MKDHKKSNRRCIVPSPGHIFLDAGFSCMEIRVMAMISKDSVLTKQRNGKNSSDCQQRCKKFVGKFSSRCPSVAPVDGYPCDCGAYEPKLKRRVGAR